MAKGIENIGLGILSGLEGLEDITESKRLKDQKSKNVKEPKSKIVNESKSNVAKEQKSKTIKEPMSKEVKEPNSITVKEQKIKRSFMLTHDQISKLYELKFKLINLDLSDMVGEAIEEYYSKRVKE